MSNKKLKRGMMFTDIHFGRKNNSKLHNQDCTDFTNWALNKADEFNVDHIDFLGDWFEERESINSLTTKYAMDAATSLNHFGVPVHFIVGNHDLYYRDNRDVYASYIYKPLTNFTLIDSPTVIDYLLEPTLYCPFLFEDEYSKLSNYFDTPIWKGHFEFKGFILTGDTVVKESGPDPSNFSAPLRIFSGHFHKRQESKNVAYIGNTFPMDYGDANDGDRGIAIYDYESNEVQYINWEKSPKYMRVNLSDVLENPKILERNSRVKCIADIDITYSENSKIKQTMMSKFGLREFNIEEKQIVVVSEGELTEEELEIETTTNIVRKLLGSIESKELDNDMLINIYDGL